MEGEGDSVARRFPLLYRMDFHSGGPVIKKAGALLLKMK